jgi:ACR3 family arsenite transporter
LVGQKENPKTTPATRRLKGNLDFFSKYLSLWVGVCIVAGTLLGYFFPSLSTFMTKLQFANVSLPIAAVLLIMMYPIMLKVNYSELLQIRKNARPISYTVIISWGIKPFTMALIAWFFMTIVFSSWIPEKLQHEYIIGMIILASSLHSNGPCLDISC